MIKKKSQSFYLEHFRSFVETAYYNEKKDQRSPNWSPFISKTSFSLEKKVENQLRQELQHLQELEAEDSAFKQKEYHFKSLLDSLQAANRGKSKFFSIPNEKVKVSDDLPFFRRKIEDIQNKIQEKNREIEKNSQMTKEYEELIKNLEFSIRKKSTQLQELKAFHKGLEQEQEKSQLSLFDSHFKRKFVEKEVDIIQSKLDENCKNSKDFKLQKHMEISENRQILRKNIKELAFDYRVRENSKNILEKTRLRIESIDGEIKVKRTQKTSSVDVKTLLILDLFEVLFAAFVGKGLSRADLKEKVEDFDKKAEDYSRNKIDGSYFLAKMMGFQEQFPDFNMKTMSLIRKFRDLSVQQETLMNRFQDLTFQRKNMRKEAEFLEKSIEKNNPPKKSFHARKFKQANLIPPLTRLPSLEIPEKNKETTSQLLDMLELHSNTTEDFKQKFEKNKLFALNCVLFLTESFYRMTNIFMNLREKKHGVYDFIDKGLVKHHEEAIIFINEKRLGHVKFRMGANQSQQKIENSETFEKRGVFREKLKRINDFQPLNDWELREILSLNERFCKNPILLNDFLESMKEEELLKYFLRKDEIIRIQIECSQQEPDELLLSLYDVAQAELHKEFAMLFEKYRDFIEKVEENSEALVMKILYYRPEFDIGLVKQSLDLAYFENENFRKSVRTRVQLISEIYGLKKNRSPVIKKQRENDEDRDLEDEYREELRQELKVCSRNVQEKKDEEVVKKMETPPAMSFGELKKIKIRIGKYQKVERGRSAKPKGELEDEMLSLRTRRFSSKGISEDRNCKSLIS